MKNKFLIVALLVLISLGLSSCLSVAKLSDFPQSSEKIDFDKYSKDYHSSSEPFWTFDTSNEYYMESSYRFSEEQLIFLIKSSLTENGYLIYRIDKENKNLIGKRGLRPNEWNTITGVYYRFMPNDSKIRIYIHSRITQDITGGWKENRAKKVGLILQKLIDNK